MKDLTGIVINNRLITGKSDEKSGGHWKWDYKCQCCPRSGRIREDEWRKTQCLCSRRPKPVINMSGQRYGKWTVTDKYEIKNDAHAYWFCHCDCGNDDWVSRPNLISGGSTNCGCVNMIDWNGMRFHSRWEIYVAMIMDELGIKYGREIDKVPVIHPDFPNKTLYYMPDFTVINISGEPTHWIEVKGTLPKTLIGEWKTTQTAEKFNNMVVIRENELNEILGCKYRNIDRIYSRGNFPAVQAKIVKIMADAEHAEKVRAMLSL